MRQINEFEDVIDSRDVQERIYELNDRDEDPDQIDPLTVDEASELALLLVLKDQCVKQFGDDTWKDSLELIHNSYLSDYVQEFVEEIGTITKKQFGEWPFNCIDWDQATDEFKYDCTEIVWNGISYWGR